MPQISEGQSEWGWEAWQEGVIPPFMLIIINETKQKSTATGKKQTEKRCVRGTFIIRNYKCRIMKDYGE